MKWQHLLLLLTLMMTFPQTASAVLDVPRDILLTQTDTTVIVDWNGDSDADGFYIYWGNTSGDLNQRAQVDNLVETYTITGLMPGTQYFVAVSAFNNMDETVLSDTLSIITATDNTAPAVPGGLQLTDINDITGDSAVIQWDDNTESDLDHYNVSYGTASGVYDTVAVANRNQIKAFPLTGLDSASRYFIAVSAVDTSDNESKNSNELIVDTLPDSRPPFAPQNISGELSGSRAITVQVSDGNTRMADLAGHIIYYGSAENTLDQSVDIGPALSYDFDNLNSSDTWYFSAAAYDQSGNVGNRTPEVSVKMEELKPFLDPNKTEGGCFIDASAEASENGFTLPLCFLLFLPVLLVFSAKVTKSRRVLILFCILFGAVLLSSRANAADDELFSRKNIIGITGGYMIPNESDFTDYYDNDLYPVYAFYQRWLSRHFSIDLEGGFLKENGNLLTASGSSTQIDSDITLVPVSASLKFNQRLMPFIVGYLGLGPDYWYVNEESDAATGANGDVSEWIGGYHGKAGFMFYNAEEAFGGTGFLTEAVYSSIDRFGGNDTDVGGWTFRIGFFYQF